MKWKWKDTIFKTRSMEELEKLYYQALKRGWIKKANDIADYMETGGGWEEVKEVKEG